MQFISIVPVSNICLYILCSIYEAGSARDRVLRLLGRFLMIFNEIWWDFWWIWVYMLGWSFTTYISIYITHSNISSVTRINTSLLELEDSRPWVYCVFLYTIIPARLFLFYMSVETAFGTRLIIRCVIVRYYFIYFYCVRHVCTYSYSISNF